MNNIRPFQIILLGVFGLFAVFGLIYFGLYKGSGSGDPAYAGGVEIWGTVDGGAVRSVIEGLTSTVEGFGQVRYIEKDPQSFNLELLNAIAEGRAPDLIVLASDQMLTHRAKLFTMPYETLSERTYRDIYVDGTDIFLFPDGIYGLPFAVDLLVMYWNRDMFASFGIPNAPRTWETLVSEVVPKLTRVGSDLTISQSAIAFGEYANVSHAKEILSMLFLQSGTNIVEEKSGSYTVTIGERNEQGLPPATAALSFYTQFALPTSATYSWNRAFASDRAAFTGGVLGTYFGFGSEYDSIERANPNLNLDIQSVPQGVTANTYRGYGIFYAFSIPRAAGNPEGAYAAMQVLTEQTTANKLAQALRMAPVHRATIAAGTTDVNDQVLYQAALISHGWLDPDSVGSTEVFRLMVEDVTSGRSRVSDAVEDAIARLRLLF
ncbi:extracellular solute-binding protein [Candidatus Kaiserbacteria bacterium]|nr:extracellular solute-binding protein [Candidatus Kaiserbacteria bacterium]